MPQLIYPGRIAAVSYLNTVPFIYGIEHSGCLRAGLILSPPSRCVAAFTEGEADIALVPVAAVPQLPDAKVVTSFCIGAVGPVRTVTLMADCPVGQIERIWLDGHSRTSAALVKILCAEYWNISPEFLQLDDYRAIDRPRKGDAFLLIGDKVFDYEGRFARIFDLAVCWQEYTGLPFVFAVWVARESVGEEVIEALVRSFEYGMGHIPESVAYYGHSGKEYAVRYLTENIDFPLDDRKYRALESFWEKCRLSDSY
ncbi:MAG: menaquinone biosynthesis protein [Rikenellaceae bacterium]|nr:menaquinone biosynthesis protein [Rikenellaceae bacterium]